MKLEELIGKLEQIEEQAAFTLREYPHGLTVERQRLIVGIAKQIRAHLVDQLQSSRRRPAQNDSGPEAQAEAQPLVDRPRSL